MSQLLLSTQEWIHHQFQQRNTIKTHQTLFSPSWKDFAKFDAKLMRHLLPHRQFTQVTTAQNFKIKNYAVLFQNISKKHKGLLTITYHKLQGYVSFFFHILNRDGKLFKLQTLQMFVQFLRNIHLTQKHAQFPLKLIANYESLEVFFQIVYFSHARSNLVDDMERTKKYTNVVLQIYKHFIQQHLSVLEKALEMVSPEEEKLEQRQQKKIVQNLYRYANMMTIKSHFSSAEIISEQAKVKFLQQRQSATRKLVSNKILVQPESLKHLQLYAICKIRKDEKNKNEFYVSGSEEKMIRKEILLQLPSTSEQTNNKDFIAFANPIHINQPEKLVLYPLNSGGFAEIFSAQVSFYLKEGIPPNPPLNLNSKAPYKKILAVKKQTKTNRKNLHQASILQELKTNYAPIVPRYYIPTNIESHPIEVSPLLMMDIMIYGNLADFMKSRKKFTFLNSKLVLMFSITNTLRFLERYKIVHLDFKPTNIMMAADLLVKIIDFGEAYHSEVVKRQGAGYKPGVTLPYSSPEVSAYRRGQPANFTAKSDIYSLGIIFYELVFGKRPIQNREDFFLVPEQCQDYGDMLLMRILLRVISSCMSSNPDLRPQLDWICLILKICLYLLI